MFGVLTANEIWKCLQRPLDEDPLFISPLLDAEIQIGSSTVDLRLGQYYLIQKPSKLSILDVFELDRNPLGNSIIAEGYTTVRVPYGSSFTLHAGQTVRAGTLEYIGMPLDLHGDVTLKHSVAGIPIMADIAKIQPGFRGVVVLSLENRSMQPVSLYPGMRIAQLELRCLSQKLKSLKTSRYFSSIMPKPIRIHEDEEIRYLGPYIDPLIIGIVSEISSGRSTAINYITKKYGFIVFTLSTRLKEIAREEGLTSERSKLQELGNKLRERNGPAYLAEQLRSSRNWIENKHSLVIVDAFKHPAEVEEFQKQRRFYLVGIDAPEERRREWERMRQETGDRRDQIPFDQVDQRDRGLGNEVKLYDLHVSDVLKHANETIHNDGTKEEFYQKLDEMLKRAKVFVKNG
jgi:dCTP deaminase